MQTTTRTLAHAAMITVVAGASIAHAQSSTAPGHNAVPASTTTPTPPASLNIAFGDVERRFDLAATKGQFVVLHILDGAKPSSEIASIVRRARSEHARIAGVRDVYALRIDKAAFDTILSSLGTDTPLYRDTDGSLASSLKLSPAGTISTVLINPDGLEVWRSSEADPIALHRSLSARVELLRRDAALQHLNLEKGLAIQGYDPVAYFADARAEKGLESITSLYRGVTYRFATPEHRATFNADPEKYAPAYGGWCATAMAYGRKVEIEPSNFKITNNRLLLFYKGIRGNALKDWNKDEPGQTLQADKNWSTLRGS